MIMIKSPAVSGDGNRFVVFKVLFATVIVVVPANTSAEIVVYSFTILAGVAIVFIPCLPRCAIANAGSIKINIDINNGFMPTNCIGKGNVFYVEKKICLKAYSIAVVV